MYVCVCVYIYIYMAFPVGSNDKESASNTGDPGSIPQSRRSPGEGSEYMCTWFIILDALVYGSNMIVDP